MKYQLGGETLVSVAPQNKINDLSSCPYLTINHVAFQISFKALLLTLEFKSFFVFCFLIG